MTTLRQALAAGLVALALSGCSTFNSLTGQTDNTVLPGQREDAIPGRTSFPEKPDVATASGTGQAQPQQETAAKSACSPDDPGCAPPKGDDVYSDPQ